MSTVKLCAEVPCFCVPQWDHWCRCSHIQVHVTLTCGWQENSILWGTRCCQGCWKYHRWSHTVMSAVFNEFALIVQTEKAWQHTVTQWFVIYSRLKSASLLVSKRYTVSMKLETRNKSVLSITNIIMQAIINQCSDTVIDVLSICLSSGSVSDYCCNGPVGMLVYAPRESKLCLPISAGLKAASIMHEDQYAVALWVRPCNSVPISSIPTNCPAVWRDLCLWIYQGSGES